MLLLSVFAQHVMNESSQSVQLYLWGEIILHGYCSRQISFPACTERQGGID